MHINKNLGKLLYYGFLLIGEIFVLVSGYRYGVIPADGVGVLYINLILWPLILSYLSNSQEWKTYFGLLSVAFLLLLVFEPKMGRVPSWIDLIVFIIFALYVRRNPRGAHRNR